MFRILAKRFISSLGDHAYNSVFYYYLHLRCGVIPKPLNLRRPASFNEKIIYLKTKVKYPNAEQYADKLAVREYVRRVGGDQYLIPLLGEWTSADEIDFTVLPDQFVLKTNHGSAMNIVCHDKGVLDILEARRQLNDWLKINYFDLGREYQYRNISPKILAEELIVPEDGGELRDYKIFCFNGEPKFVQVDVNRHTNHTRNFFDCDWNKLPFTILYPAYVGAIEKPSQLEVMLALARKLAQPFIFARIDLYTEREKVYFGEITFHHGGGFEPVMPPHYADVLGDLIEIGAV